MSELTEAQHEALVCDCLRDEFEPHGHTCATNGEYDVLMNPNDLAERVVQMIEEAELEAIARERERIAQAIEANWSGDTVYDFAVEDAARIARGGE